MLKFLVVAIEENDVLFFPVLKMMFSTKKQFLINCVLGSHSPPGLPTGPQDPLSAFEMTRLALLKVGCKIFPKKQKLMVDTL